MTVIPGVRYAKSGDYMIAYQVVGNGPKDLVYLLFETPSVAGNWLVPEHARFMERLASFSRLVVTDRRGMGCSDRLPPGRSPTLEELVDDLLVVMEAGFASTATLLAGFETAFVAMLAAATHPDRFQGLILYGASPSWRQSEDLPWERSEDRLEADLGVIRRATDLHMWAQQYVRDNYPSLAGDEEAISVQEALSALAGTPTTGSRVGALARPSEVLVSQTVKDLVAGSGLVFEDAGEHELKGIPDRWRLYRVVG